MRTMIKAAAAETKIFIFRMISKLNSTLNCITNSVRLVAYFVSVIQHNKNDTISKRLFLYIKYCFSSPYNLRLSIIKINADIYGFAVGDCIQMVFLVILMNDWQLMCYFIQCHVKFFAHGNHQFQFNAQINLWSVWPVKIQLQMFIE